MGDDNGFAVRGPIELGRVNAQLLRRQRSNCPLATQVFISGNETQPNWLQVLIHNAPVALFFLCLFLFLGWRLSHTESDLGPVWRPA